MKKKIEKVISSSEISMFLDTVLINYQDINLLQAGLKAINEGQILLPWREVKGRVESYLARDAFVFRRAIVIREQEDYYNKTTNFKIEFASKAYKINILFDNYIQNHEHEIITNPDFVYHAGKSNLKLYDLVFRSIQGAKDFCDKVLISGGYKLL